MLHECWMSHHLKVSGAEVDGDVEDVEEIGEIVEREPDEEVGGADLVEGDAVDDDPKVVEIGEGHDEAPVVAEAPGRVEDEGPAADCGEEG